MPYGPRRHDFEDSDLAERYIVELPKSGSHWVPPSCYLDALDESKLDLQTFAKRQGLSVKAELPQGLKKYAFMTKIQFLAIPHILQGRDVIAEAATGGGKTLCFVIPILEAIRRDVWQREDGCFALIMTPTRELALQIFEVIALFKEHTAVSAMTVFGGKHMLEEQKRIRDIAIVIGTPGRILSHLEETYQFTTEGIKMVILDEADKLIELGFLETTERILAALPPKEARQNLFFSATLRSASRLLARKFCNQENCEKITEQFEGIVDMTSSSSSRLHHTYMIIKAVDDKIATLYSLLCANFKKKIIVFCSTIKQVRFLYETFTEMKTGARILEIHGKQDQGKRMYVFDEFNRRRAAISIISTDLLGRGVDFPDVDLVIQFDCPPDVATYTHRAGRTARGVERTGESILFLLSSEQVFLSRLKEKGFVVDPAVPLKYVRDTTPNLRGLCARRADVKQLAIKFFISTIKAYSLLTDTEVFKIQSLLMRRSAFVASLGLVNIPELPSDLAELTGADTQASTIRVDEADDQLDGGVEKSVKVKNKSRLDRLKDKIAAKMAAKVADKMAMDKGLAVEDSKHGTISTAETIDSDQEGPKISRREKRRLKLQEIRQMGAAELMKDDTKLEIDSCDLRGVVQEALIEAVDQSVPVTEAPVDTQNWRESEQVKKALRKQRLVIRADGTAKIKGAAKLIPTTHKFFGGDEDEAVDAGTFEGALRMMELEGREEVPIETREQRIKRIQANLKEAREAEIAAKAAKRHRHKKSSSTTDGETAALQEADLESQLALEFNL